MKQFILIMFMILLAGCGSIPQDPSPAPIDNNLFTLEMASCDKREVGLLYCQDGSAQATLEVPLWHKGEYKIESDMCAYYENQRFDGNQTLRRSYEELLRNRGDVRYCVYDLMVFVDGFDSGFRGQFVITRERFKKAKFNLFSHQLEGLGYFQIREGSNITDSLKFEANYPGKIIWAGCDLDGERFFESNPRINFQEIIDGYLTEAESCILTVGIIPESDSIPVELATVGFSIFAKPVQAMADPVFKYKRGKLRIEAPWYVAAIAVDNKHKVFKGKRTKKWKVKVPANKEVLVRVATASGRFKLYKVKNGRITWKNSLIW